MPMKTEQLSYMIDAIRKRDNPKEKIIMLHHNTNYINAINMLRASTDAHPEHNRHIQ